jgi:transcriptional regulator with XRE-family HTH domain
MVLDFSDYKSNYYDMDWMKFICFLCDDGWTQSDIAAKASCSQSMVSALKTGTRKEPGWGLGQRLLALSFPLPTPAPDQEAAHELSEVINDNL